MLNAFRQLWPYLARYRRDALLGLAALIAKSLLLIAQPLLMRAAIDRLMAGFSYPVILGFAAALVVVSATKGLFQFWMRVRLISLSRDIEFEIRNDLFAHLTSLDQYFYGRSRTGDLISRSTSDLNAIRMMLGPGVMYWTETVMLFVFAVTVMLMSDWRLTLFAMAPAPLVSIAVVYFGRRIHVRFEAIQAQFSEISSRVTENLSGVRLIRAYVQERPELDLFGQLNKEYIRQSIGLARTSGLMSPLLQFLVGCTFLSVLWAGGISLMQGRITLGSFVMFNTYLSILVWPMIAFGWVINLTQRGTASWSRVAEILNRKPSIDSPTNPESLSEPVRGKIEFRGVSLVYGEQVALDNIDLEIPAGSTTAIVGHTGSGKTSLVNLMPRLLDPTSGQVLVDGKDVRTLDPRELRRNFGFVPQESFLFSTSIADNVAFGVIGASRESIEEAVRIAGLEHDIDSMPEGLDTVIGERGITLSGGQKQRTAIARAILRNPRILVLDDALSSVDTVTEERILTSLSGLFFGRTTILISHRVSTVRHADRIIVLEQGRIVEQGTHYELLASGKRYAELHEHQLLEEELEAI